MCWLFIKMVDVGLRFEWFVWVDVDIVYIEVKGSGIWFGWEGLCLVLIDCNDCNDM